MRELEISLWHVRERFPTHEIGCSDYRVVGWQSLACIECFSRLFERLMLKTFWLVRAPILLLARDLRTVPDRLASGTTLKLCHFCLDFSAAFSATHSVNTILGFRVLISPVPDGRFHPKVLGKPEVVLGVFRPVHRPSVHVQVTWWFKSS